MYELIVYVLWFIVILYVIFWQGCLLWATVFGAPTVYASDEGILDSFKLAKLKKGELVIDLGCGNAKSLIIAAQKFGARGIGIERSPYAYLAARFNVWRHGESHRIKIRFGDFHRLEKELKRADVVYLYLLSTTLQGIEPWFFKSISPKTRAVALSFPFSAHKPKSAAPTRSLGRDTRTYLY